MKIEMNNQCCDNCKTSGVDNTIRFGEKSKFFRLCPFCIEEAKALLDLYEEFPPKKKKK